MLHVSRRQRAVLAAFALMSASLTAAAPAVAADGPKPFGNFKHVVVIYEENHSFDNLYGLWGDVNGQPVMGLADATAAHTTQISQAGNAYQCLKQLDVNLDTDAAGNTLSKVCNPETVDLPGQRAPPPTRATFRTRPSTSTSTSPRDATTCPRPNQEFSFPNGIRNGALQADGVTPVGLPGGCTRDLVHKFYQEQYQLDGGSRTAT